MSTLMTAVQLVDVQPARGHIGGHQHRAAAVGKLGQHLVALALLQVAMQGLGAQSRLAASSIHQVVALLLGVAKGHGAGRSEVVEQLAHRVQAGLAVVTS